MWKGKVMKNNNCFKLVKVLMLISLIVFSVMTFISFYEKMQVVSNERIISRIELYSIVYDEDVEGRFRLGSGRINERDYYVAYRVFEDGAKILYKIPAENTYVYDVLKDGETAYIEETRNGYGTLLDCRIYLPENTIIQEYDMSLK